MLNCSNMPNLIKQISLCLHNQHCLLLLLAILSFEVFRADAKLCEEYLAEI